MRRRLHSPFQGEGKNERHHKFSEKKIKRNVELKNWYSLVFKKSNFSKFIEIWKNEELENFTDSLIDKNHCPKKEIKSIFLKRKSS